jgi:hypothetical protein
VEPTRILEEPMEEEQKEERVEEPHPFEPTVRDARRCVFCGGELYALSHEGLSWGTFEEAALSETLYPFWNS